MTHKFVAHVLAPFSSLPLDVVFVLWTAAGLLALLATMRLVGRETLVARAPLVLFSSVYLWGSLWMGQVNLFALAGLLLAFGSRSGRLAGLGLALATATRAFPGRLRSCSCSSGGGGPSPDPRWSWDWPSSCARRTG